MEEKKQVLIIRGGETFANKEDFYEYLRTVKLDPYHTSKKWRDWISWALTETHEVLEPLMPSKQNADYVAWKIWFERHFEFIKDEPIILIGHSLGATFLLKYMSENTFPKKISQLHLVAPYIEDEPGMFLEKLSSFEFDVSKIESIRGAANEIHIWHSVDDNVVPFSNSETVYKYLPNANFHKFTDRGHFNQPAFIEILQVINNK